MWYELVGPLGNRWSTRHNPYDNIKLADEITWPTWFDEERRVIQDGRYWWPPKNTFAMNYDTDRLIVWLAVPPLPEDM